MIHAGATLAFIVWERVEAQNKNIWGEHMLIKQTKKKKKKIIRVFFKNFGETWGLAPCSSAPGDMRSKKDRAQAQISKWHVSRTKFYCPSN